MEVLKNYILCGLVLLLARVLPSLRIPQCTRIRPGEETCHPCSGSNMLFEEQRGAATDQNINSIKSHLLGRIATIRNDFNNISNLLESVPIQRTTSPGIIPLMDLSFAEDVSDIRKVYDILNKWSLFVSMTLTQYGIHHGVCVHDSTHQSNIRSALCYVKQLMLSHNCTLPLNICRPYVVMTFQSNMTLLKGDINSQMPTLRTNLDSLRNIIQNY